MTIAVEHYRTDAIVIGAGVVGLACARALAQAGREVVVLEKEASFGAETSSRNSEVIHAGIYYPAGSLMAETCVDGRQQLYAYCRDHNVPHRQIGKLIVATNDAEVGRLAAIRASAERNGVADLEILTGAQARVLEPSLQAAAALLSPSTGILDSHAYMLALKGDAEDAGCAFAFHSAVETISVAADGFLVDIATPAVVRLAAPILVNAAGLHASAVARRIDGLDAAHVPTPYYAKGSYFTLRGPSPFARLIYPVPVPGGLGTHLTLDLAGQARFGPDVEWIETIDYAVDPDRATVFAEAIRRYWPKLDVDMLQPGYAGVRPKIRPPGEGPQDFVIQTSATHGLLGLVNVFGIESPGLTASLALAQRVANAIVAA